MAQSKSPENARPPKGNRRGDDKVQHQPAGLAKRFDQQSRWNIRHDDDRNDPAENKTKDLRKNHVRITRDIEEIEVAVNQSLRTHDPETYRGEAEHDRVMDRDSEHRARQVEQERRSHSEQYVKM